MTVPQNLSALLMAAAMVRMDQSIVHPASYSNRCVCCSTGYL